MAVASANGPELLTGEIVAPAYFKLLRVTPLRGRFLRDDEDDAAGAHPLVVLSHELWTRSFNARADIVGQTVRISDVAFTIIGVAPAEFHGLTGRALFWVPSTMAPIISYAEYLTTNQNFISAVGRLRPGVDIEQAKAELAVLGTTINSAIPSTTSDPLKKFSATAMPINEARIDAVTKRSVLTLLAAVALLYLLACANVTNLLLTRAASRHRETAVRAALGSSRTRLLGFQVSEGIVLSVTGGALGLMLASWTSAVVTVPTALWNARNLYGSLGAFDTPAFDTRVFTFGLILVAFTVLLVCVAPAFSMTRLALLPALRAGARGVAPGAGTLRRPTVRGVVVAFEAALAVLLLVAGGLMITSFERMRSTNVGVNPENVLTFMLRPSEIRVPVSAASAYITRVLEAVTSVPGVVSASVDGGAPVNGSARTVVHVVGAPPLRDDQAPPVNRHYVAPDHFHRLGMRVLAGRSFLSSDIAGRAKVTVISESAARRFWPGQNALGQRVWFGSTGTWGSADSSAEVVGIVNDVAHAPLDENPNLNEFYTPYAQFSYSWRVYFVKTSGSPNAAIPAIRNAVLAVEPDVPITDVQSLGELIGHSWERHRFDAVLFAAFAAVALLLASVGIYSVVSYAVSQRTRELGIRLALGADPSTILRLVVREGMVFPVLGLAVGVIGSLAATRVLRASLYQIAPTDPAVFSATVLLLIVVCALACYAPARRATRVNPTEALRAD